MYVHKFIKKKKKKKKDYLNKILNILLFLKKLKIIRIKIFI